jgi:hypothetical protein
MKTKTKTDMFRLASGMLVVGDPCYATNKKVPALNGMWTAHVETSDEGDWGVRVKSLLVHHVDFNPADRRIKSKSFTFGVDSGQAGAFDSSFYGSDGFYDICCRKTLSRSGCGYVDGGFVSTSGFGDGCYDAEVQSVDGRAVCVELVFIG